MPGEPIAQSPQAAGAGRADAADRHVERRGDLQVARLRPGDQQPEQFLAAGRQLA